MNPYALEALEADIASGGDDAAVFAKMLGAVPALRAFVDASAYADAAIAIHRALLPGHGFQLGETASQRGLATSWQKGDCHTRPFEAATPALALLRATAHIAAHRLRTIANAACPVCQGLGWFITKDGGKRICGHGR